MLEEAGGCDRVRNQAIIYRRFASVVAQRVFCVDCKTPQPEAGELCLLLSNIRITDCQ